MRTEFFEDRNIDETTVIVHASSRTEDIEELMEYIRAFTPSPITGYSDGVLTRVKKDSIIRIYSKDKRVYADTVDASYLLKSTLYRLEEELPKNFVRISNSEIVNSDKIIRMDLITRQEETIAELKAKAGEPGAGEAKTKKLFPFFRGFYQQPQQQPPAQ